jgi:hypothetical protein
MVRLTLNTERDQFAHWRPRASPPFGSYAGVAKSADGEAPIWLFCARRSAPWAFVLVLVALVGSVKDCYVSPRDR